MNFEEAGKEYVVLKEQLDQGGISKEDFQSGLENLLVESPDGKKWRIDPTTGTWVEGEARQGMGTATKEKNQAPQTLLQLFSAMAKGLVKSIPKLILMGLLMSVLTWFAHTYLVAKVNDGLMYVAGNVTLNSIVHLQETYFPGVNVFWGLLAYFISGFVMRIRSMGFKSWAENIKGLPENVKVSVLKDKEKSITRIIVGVFIALLVSLLYRNFMLSWILALGMLLILTAHFQSIEILVLRLGLSDLQRFLRRRFMVVGQENDSIFLMITGMCGGFLLAGLLQTRVSFLVISTLLIIGAFIFFKSKENQRFAFSLLIIGGALLLFEETVLAWCEGGSYSQAGSWSAWWGSNNADTVRRLGYVPAATSFAGGAIGAAAAGAAPEFVGAAVADQVPVNTATPRTDQEIYEDPRPNDRITAGDGKEYIYHKPVGDMAPEPFWVPIEDYEKEMWHRKQGHVFQGGVWMEPDVAAQRQQWLEQTRRENELRNQEANRRYEESMRRKEAEKQMAKSEADRLESLRQRIESGRLNVGEDKENIIRNLENFINQTRDSGSIDENSYDKLRESVTRGLSVGQDKNVRDMIHANNVAWRWDVATKTAEYTKSGADLAIAGLAKVTGPKGRAIERMYKDASAVAGGVGQGMATGNWTEAAIETGAQLADNAISGRLKTTKSKNYYKVVRSGTKSGYKSGLEAYKSGDGDVAGAFARGALEGAAGGASEIAKDSLGTVGKFYYGMGEEATKGAYNAALQGGDMSQVLEGARKGSEKAFYSGLGEAAFDKAFDHYIPSTGAVDSDVIAQHQWEILKTRNLENPLEVLNETLPLEDWIRDTLKDEVRNFVKSGAKKTVKGEGLLADLVDMGWSYKDIRDLSKAWGI